MKLKWTTLLTLLTLSSVAGAQIYKCPDPATGKLNFTDVSCKRVGSSQLSGGDAGATTAAELSADEMKKRLRDAEKAIHKARANLVTKKAMHTASKDEDPRFFKMLNDDGWRFKTQQACRSAQNVGRQDNIDSDRLTKCTYQQEELHINQLADLSGDTEIRQLPTSSIYPDIERKPETESSLSGTVLLKKGRRELIKPLPKAC